SADGPDMHLTDHPAQSLSTTAWPNSKSLLPVTPMQMCKCPSRAAGEVPAKPAEGARRTASTLILVQGRSRVNSVDQGLSSSCPRYAAARRGKWADLARSSSASRTVFV